MTHTTNVLAGLLLLVVPTIARAADAPQDTVDLRAEAKAQKLPAETIAPVNPSGFPNRGRSVWFIVTPPPPAGPRFELFHDTNEWNPSVGNDGKIVYTRWDYVDREPDVAHHIWTCFPDGRDPRSFHGNYPNPKRPKNIPGENRFGHRPFGEWSCRAVPGHNFWP